MTFMKDDHSKMVTKEDVLSRLNAVYSEINIKLNDRPTIEYLRNHINSLHNKIDSIKADVEL